jgi:hypothetical protein
VLWELSLYSFKFAHQAPVNRFMKRMFAILSNTDIALFDQVKRQHNSAYKH